MDRKTLEMLAADLGVAPTRLHALHEAPSPPEPSSGLVVTAERPPLGSEGSGMPERIRSRLGRGGCLLHVIPLPFTPSRAAAFRNALWPHLHVGAVYRVEPDRSVLRLDLSGWHRLPGSSSAPSPAFVLAARRREDVLDPEAVTAKFDRNAPGWNGDPASPLYGHFRWMRRIMAEAACPLAGRTVLDAGCGAGWVGIEAARLGGRVSAFDPSPEMVRLARVNAAAESVSLDARVGFGERVPFEERFDAVISSGVISFAGDAGRFLDGLDACLRPGGVLVVGDLNPRSVGMRLRRRRRPVLPFRELNALPRPRLAALLRARGYTLEDRGYYQLTLPVPRLMHLSERRIGGRGASFLLLLNRCARRMDGLLGSPWGLPFDSYFLRARKVREG